MNIIDKGINEVFKAIEVFAKHEKDILIEKTELDFFRDDDKFNHHCWKPTLVTSWWRLYGTPSLNCHFNLRKFKKYHPGLSGGQVKRIKDYWSFRAIRGTHE